MTPKVSELTHFSGQHGCRCRFRVSIAVHVDFELLAVDVDFEFLKGFGASRSLRLVRTLSLRPVSLKPFGASPNAGCQYTSQTVENFDNGLMNCYRSLSLARGPLSILGFGQPWFLDCLSPLSLDGHRSSKIRHLSGLQDLHCWICRLVGEGHGRVRGFCFSPKP